METENPEVLAQREKTYAHAMELMEDGNLYSLESAIMFFTQAGDYKDAQENIGLCKEKMKKIRTEQMQTREEFLAQQAVRDRRAARKITFRELFGRFVLIPLTILVIIVMIYTIGKA